MNLRSGHAAILLNIKNTKIFEKKQISYYNSYYINYITFAVELV